MCLASGFPPFGILELLLDFFVELLELLFQDSVIRVGEVLKMDETITRGTDSADEFVEFRVHGFRVTVLRVLDEEDHQKRDECCPRIDNELPRVRVMECRSSDSPGGDS